MSSVKFSYSRDCIQSDFTQLGFGLDANMMNNCYLRTILQNSCWWRPTLTLNVPCISESYIEIKIKLNFYFHTSLWGLKALIKPWYCKIFKNTYFEEHLPMLPLQYLESNSYWQNELHLHSITFDKFVNGPMKRDPVPSNNH